MLIRSLYESPTSRWSAALVLGIMASSASGCSSSEKSPAPPAGAAGSPDVEPDGGAALTCSDDDTLDLSGIFAVIAKLNFQFSSQPGGAVRVCPLDQTSDGSFLGLMQIEHQPGQNSLPTVKAVVCTLELPVVSAVAGECSPSSSNLVYAWLEFPQALIDSVPTASTGTTSGSLTGTAKGSAFDLGRLFFTIGSTVPGDQMATWETGNPGCGPNDNMVGRGSACAQECVSDCSSLVDHDDDGWPGVTVHVCGYTQSDKDKSVPCEAEEPNTPGATIQGRAMLNLQVDPLFKGTAESSCELTGSLDSAIQYNVVGADLYVANTQVSVTSALRSLPGYDVNVQNSRFRAVRIDGKYGAPDWSPNFDEPLASCKTIITRQNELQ